MMKQIQPIVTNALAKFSEVVTAQVQVITRVQGLSSQMSMLKTEFSELKRLKTAIDKQEERTRKLEGENEVDKAA